MLKSHYNPTAERASVVRKAVPGVDVLGAVTLNASVGGMNPVAVEIAARSGARVVWLPTVDAINQRKSRAADPPGATPPPWAALQDELVAQGIEAPPVHVLGADGEVLPEVRQVLSLIARHDMVLATGHLGREEIMAVTAAAHDLGVRRIIITHPEFTSQRLPVSEQAELAGRGALLERCFTTPYTGKVSWETMLENVRAAGPEHSFLSSRSRRPGWPSGGGRARPDGRLPAEGGAARGRRAHDGRGEYSRPRRGTANPGRVGTGAATAPCCRPATWASPSSRTTATSSRCAGSTSPSSRAASSAFSAGAGAASPRCST